MKTSLLTVLGAVLAVAATGAHAVEFGANRAEVVAELGEPAGEIASGNLTILFFDRGEVHLRNDRVSAIDLVSAEELEERRRAEAAEIERIRAAREAHRARLEAEGLALYDRKISDPAFQTAPPAERVRFWRWFASQYPMISVDEELLSALSEFDRERELRDQQQSANRRIQELEGRLEEAERRAERAEGLPSYGVPNPFLSGGRVYHRDRHGSWRRDDDGEAQRPQPGIRTSRDLRSEAMSGIEAARDRAYQSINPPRPQQNNSSGD